MQALQTIDEPMRPIDHATETAAATAMRRTAERIDAVGALDLVLDVLFGETKS